MNFDATPVVVYGIKLANKDVASLVRKVLVLSFLAAAVVIALTVLNFTILKDRTTIAQSVMTCLIGITIPFLGWFGARASNRNMLGMFCAFSFSCALFNLVSYIIVMISASWLDGVLGDCRSDGTVLIDGVARTDICDFYTHEDIVRLYIIASCVTWPVVILQCLGAVYGNRLYSELTPGVVITYSATPFQGYNDVAVVRVGSPIVTVPYPTAPPVVTPPYKI